MGCCSGGSDDANNKEVAPSTDTKPKINLDNYTYFPGSIKQTDYTNSQVRTGWASEMDRKRNISQTIYYNPSYVVLGHHGRGRLAENFAGSNVSKYFNRNTAGKNNDSKKTRFANIEKCEETEGPYIKKKRNYFGIK